MRRLFGVALVACGVMAAPAVANAASLEVNNICEVDPSEIVYCDIFADYDDAGDGVSTLDVSTLVGLPFELGDYLPGYTVLLNATADLEDGLDVGDVAHILVITDSVFTLHSNTVYHSSFAMVFSDATSGAGASDGQLAGCPPNPDGVPTVAGVGYCPNSDLVGPLAINWGTQEFAGMDFLTIHTALRDVEPTPNSGVVPEPGTLSLVGLGASALAMRRRRKARTESTR